jgi:RNA polymerase sporulation-specific sigma factor
VLAAIDEELAVKAQSGSIEAEQELTARYWPVCAFLAHEYTVKGTEFEDRRSEAAVALVKAVRRYVPGRGSSFKTFAKLLMRNALVEMARTGSARSRVAPAPLISLQSPPNQHDDDITIEESTPGKSDTMAEVAKKMEADALVNRICELQAAVLWHVAEGMEHAEIADQLGIPITIIPMMMKVSREIAKAPGFTLAA